MTSKHPTTLDSFYRYFFTAHFLSFGKFNYTVSSNVLYISHSRLKCITFCIIKLYLQSLHFHIVHLMLAYMCMCYQKKKGIKTQSKVYCQNISPLNFLIIPKASPDKFDFRKYRAFKKSYCIISRNSKDLSNFY